MIRYDNKMHFPEVVLELQTREEQKGFLGSVIERYEWNLRVGSKVFKILLIFRNILVVQTVSVSIQGEEGFKRKFAGSLNMPTTFDLEGVVLAIVPMRKNPVDFYLFCEGKQVGFSEKESFEQNSQMVACSLRSKENSTNESILLKEEMTKNVSAAKAACLNSVRDSAGLRFEGSSSKDGLDTNLRVKARQIESFLASPSCSEHIFNPEKNFGYFEEESARTERRKLSPSKLLRENSTAQLILGEKKRPGLRIFSPRKQTKDLPSPFELLGNFCEQKEPKSSENQLNSSMTSNRAIKDEYPQGPSLSEPSYASRMTLQIHNGRYLIQKKEESDSFRNFTSVKPVSEIQINQKSLHNSSYSAYPDKSIPIELLNEVVELFTFK